MGVDPASRPSTRVLFLDAEGTLWNPPNEDAAADFWAHPTVERATQIFQVELGLPRILQRLQDRGVELVVLSRHVAPLLHALLDAFGLRRFFSAILVGHDKAALASDYLRRHGWSAGQALMVGDSWEIDVLPLRRIGVEALLVDRFGTASSPSIPRLQALENLLLAPQTRESQSPVPNTT